MAETKNFMAKLVRAWPALPYMALGALLASVYIASSGTAWLSDSETNGGNLSVLTVTTSLSAGGLMLLSTFAVPRVRSWLERPTACLWAGAVSSLGALIVILIGPYYLSPVLPYFVIRSLFFIGGIFFGVGLGTIALDVYKRQPDPIPNSAVKPHLAESTAAPGRGRTGRSARRGRFSALRPP